MISIEKTFGIQSYANSMTLLHLQEVIALAKEQYGFVGKAKIDCEKITFYKFGLKLGYAWHSSNGLVVDEFGKISYVGMQIPILRDSQILNNLRKIFK